MKDIIYAVIFILLGLFFFLKPELCWKISHLLDTKGGEQSDYYLNVCKVSGIFVIAVGIIVILFEIF